MVPRVTEGQLSGQQIADITAFMLQYSTFPAGGTEPAGQSIDRKQVKDFTEDM